MKEQIKELRVQIDGLVQLTKELKPLEIERNILEKSNSKEIEKAVDSLYLAKAWLNKILQKLEEETPYKNDGKRKTVEDIEPTADVPGKKSTSFQLWINNPSHIEKVDWLRQEIEKIAGIVLELNGGKLNRVFFTEYQEKLQWNSYNHLCEARFWLGFELQRIKNEI